MKKFEFQDFKTGAQVEAKAGDEARAELAKALAKIERSSEFHVHQIHRAQRAEQMVSDLSKELATAGALLDKASECLASHCRCDKRLHLNIAMSDWNRQYYERETCQLCIMVKEIEQHRGGKL